MFSKTIRPQWDANLQRPEEPPSKTKDVALQKLPVRFVLDRAGLVGADSWGSIALLIVTDGHADTFAHAWLLFLTLDSFVDKTENRRTEPPTVEPLISLTWVGYWAYTCPHNRFEWNWCQRSHHCTLRRTFLQVVFLRWWFAHLQTRWILLIIEAREDAQKTCRHGVSLLRRMLSFSCTTRGSICICDKMNGIQFGARDLYIINLWQAELIHMVHTLAQIDDAPTALRSDAWALQEPSQYPRSWTPPTEFLN